MITATEEELECLFNFYYDINLQYVNSICYVHYDLTRT